MAVETLVRLVMGQVLYWSYFLLSIALIYSLVMLFLGGGEGGVASALGSLIGGGSGGGGGGGGGGGWFRRRKKKDKPETPGGPEDTTPNYKGWTGGFANVTVWVTDEDDNGIQGAFVTIKHQKLGEIKMRQQRTGPDGTVGPKKVPAGGIMVKASKRGFFQFAILAGAGRILLGSIFGALGGTLAGLSALLTDRYIMKDWDIVEPDEDKLFQIRLHRQGGQKDHGFRPFIELIADNDDGTTRIQGRIDGGIR